MFSDSSADIRMVHGGFARVGRKNRGKTEGACKNGNKFWCGLLTPKEKQEVRAGH